MSRLRQGIGPLLIALAAWCAAGTLTVASADSSSARLVTLAPAWIPLVALFAASAVPSFRQRPWTAAPALLSVLPWLPIPTLPVLLIWTGPLAWAPIVLSLALAIGIAPLKWLFRAINLFEPDDATVAALVLSAALGWCAAYAAAPRLPGGDEPSYMLISTSLLKDGDLDLDNNYARKDYASFYGGVLPTDYRQRGVHGEQYSIHAPGVSVLIAPLFQFFGYTGARVMIVLLTSIGAMLIWRLAWRVTDSPEAAWFAWAAVVFTPMFAMQSFMVFPDGPGLIAVAAGVLMVVQLSRGDLPGLLPATLTGVALAALPWLHTRFAVLSAGLGAVIALRLLTFDAPVKARISRLAAVLAIPIVSALLWFYFFKVLYGTFDPRAPYAHEPQDAAWIAPAILALFFDGQFGLAAYAPAIAAVFAGFVMRPLLVSRRLLVELGLIALVYLVAVGSVRMWWAGVPATPARFLMAVLPILAVPLAMVWTRAQAAARAVLTGLVGVGALVTAGLLAVDRAGYMWETRNDVPAWLEKLSPIANLSRVWPGFFWDEPQFPLHVVVVVGLAAALWLVVRRLPVQPRAAAGIWAVAAFFAIAPVSWAVTGARQLDPAPAQLALVHRAGDGARVFAIGTGKVASQRALSGALKIRLAEPGVKVWTPTLAWFNVPAGRYVLRTRSSSSFPMKVRLRLGRLGGTWRALDVPGAGEFSFPVLVPTDTDALVIDADAAAARSLSFELGVESAINDPGLRARGAAQFGNAGVLFLDDMAYVESDGFWVKGKQAANFVVVPGNAAAATFKLLVRNGASPNQVSVESGTFQRLLVMSPGQEQEFEIPVTPGANANVRVASGDGFTPAEKNPEGADRRFLGVWIEIR